MNLIAKVSHNFNFCFSLIEASFSLLCEYLRLCDLFYLCFYDLLFDIRNYLLLVFKFCLIREYICNLSWHWIFKFGVTYFNYLSFYFSFSFLSFIFYANCVIKLRVFLFRCLTLSYAIFTLSIRPTPYKKYEQAYTFSRSRML